MRLTERAWLIPALQQVLATLPQEEVARRCERFNVSWAPVGQPGDLFTDPHLLATGGLVEVFISRFGGGDGKFAGLPALPIEFGGDRRRPGYRASRRGSASTTPKCWAKQVSSARKLPPSRKLG
jgi:crotonobetainyl-CoA:carnitine CoA-transferase CaiB-like acyl-CoA transferase